MPTCKQVTREIASDALVMASWRRRVAVRVHLLLCRHCRRYEKQMRAIGSAVRTVFQVPDEDGEVLERLGRRIEREAAEARRATVE